MRFHAPIRPYCLLKYESIKTYKTPFKYEPRSEKTGLRGFRPGPTQTRLYSH